MSKEKRIYKRSAVEMAASFGAVSDQECINETMITNISGGGFSFYSKEQIKNGEVIHLTFELEKTPVILKVKIVWSKFVEASGEYILGVQIVEKTTENFERFFKYYTNLIR